MCLEGIQPIQEPIDKKSGWRLGSGAGVVWMAIPMRGWVQPPAMRNGDCLKVILPLSNFTRTLEQPEQRRTEELLNTVEWSARSWVQASLPPKIFLAIFHLGNSRNNVCTFYMWYSVSGVYLIIVMWQIIRIGDFGYFASEIKASCLYFKKSGWYFSLNMILGVMENKEATTSLPWWANLRKSPFLQKPALGIF